MRLLVLLSLAAFVALQVPFGLLTASDAECPAQEAAASNARGLILQQPDGDRRVRRPWPGSVARMPTASMIIRWTNATAVRLIFSLDMRRSPR